MSVNTSPYPTALGRYVAKFFDYAVYYGVEILLICLILYICVSRGLTFSVDVYDPLEPQAASLTEASVGGWLTGVGETATALLASFSTPGSAVTTSASAPERTVAIDAKQ